MIRMGLPLSKKSLNTYLQISQWTTVQSWTNHLGKSSNHVLFQPKSKSPSWINNSKILIVFNVTLFRHIHSCIYLTTFCKFENFVRTIYFFLSWKNSHQNTNITWLVYSTRRNEATYQGDSFRRESGRETKKEEPE